MWHNDRWQLILDGCGIDVWSEPSLERQLDALWWELTMVEKLALQEIRSAQSSYDSGAAGCRYYERAGAPAAMQKRGMMGQRLETFVQLHPQLF
jgi:hypothetical protein